MATMTEIWDAAMAAWEAMGEAATVDDVLARCPPTASRQWAESGLWAVRNRKRLEKRQEAAGPS